MAVYDERIPQVKQIPPQPKKKGSRKLLFLLVFFFLTILTVLFIRSPYSKVSEIRVTGNSIYNPDEIIAASGVTKGMQFFAVFEGVVQKNASVLKGINEITITREFPGIIQLHIKEYRRIALVFDASGKRYPLLENGMQLLEKNYQNNVVDRPIIRNWGTKELLEPLGKQLAQLPTALLTEISDISLTPTQYDKSRITLFMKDGNQVQSVIHLLAKKIVWYPAVVKEIPKGEKGTIYMLESTWYSKYGSTQPPEPPKTDDEKKESTTNEGT
ncbi:cell division protein FtsQ/DivIB [Brevibacillus sp. SYSU BS000544]|uniref:cell division protein FtsQ/DivIB n=1 Tax=Brevibacillus sp. SYSU BS000544 TaxID=3416443 RepID=UPI003CE57729